VAALVLALVGGCGIGSVLGIVFGLMGLATVPALNALHGPPRQAGDAGGVPTAELVVINSVTITES